MCIFTLVLSCKASKAVPHVFKIHGKVTLTETPLYLICGCRGNKKDKYAHKMQRKLHSYKYPLLPSPEFCKKYETGWNVHFMWLSRYCSHKDKMRNSKLL